MYFRRARVLPTPEQLFGKLVNRGWVMCPWLVVHDTRLTSAETRCLYLLIQRLFHERRATVAVPDQELLAGWMGKSARTIRDHLARMTLGSPKCQVPLLEAIGPDNTQRRFRLRPLAVVYGDAVDEGFPVVLEPSMSFEKIHGPWVAEHGFVPMPVPILRDFRLSAASRLAFIVLSGILRERGLGTAVKLKEIGLALGVSNWEMVRDRLAEWDRGINPKCEVPLAESVKGESNLRVWNLREDLGSLYPAGGKQDKVYHESCQQERRGEDLFNEGRQESELSAGEKTDSNAPVSRQRVEESLAENVGDSTSNTAKEGRGVLTPAGEKGEGSSPETRQPSTVEKKNEEITPPPSPSALPMPTSEVRDLREVVEWIVSSWKRLRKMLGAAAIEKLVNRYIDAEFSLADRIDLIGDQLDNSSFTPDDPIGWITYKIRTDDLTPSYGYKHWSKRMEAARLVAGEECVEEGGMVQQELPFPMPDKWKGIWWKLEERTRRSLVEQQPIIAERGGECWLLARPGMEVFLAGAHGEELNRVAVDAGYEVLRIDRDSPGNRVLCGIDAGIS